MGLSDLFMEGVGAPCCLVYPQKVRDIFWNKYLEEPLKKGFLVGGRDPEMKATQIKPIGL